MDLINSTSRVSNRYYEDEGGLVRFFALGRERVGCLSICIDTRGWGWGA